MALLEEAILHELLHAYENHEKVTRNLPSIFDELSEDYLKSREHTWKEIDPETAMVTLKYYLDPHERNAFFAMLTKDIEYVLKDVDPKKYNPKLSEIKNKLQQLTSWRRYFEFCKFACDIKNYSDQSLQKAYYKAIKSSKEQKDAILKDIERNRQGKSAIKYAGTKSASEIRKEIKAKHLKFIKKFNQLFPKLVYEYLSKN